MDREIETDSKLGRRTIGQRQKGGPNRKNQVSKTETEIKRGRRKVRKIEEQ